MSHATKGIPSQAVAVTRHALSSIMFSEGDEVKARNAMLPFWMTVTQVNERTGYCRCAFGASGRDAGNFHYSELRFNGGAQINVALAN